jgi:3',5'-cyclic-nucleotide phosphodiesterase
VVITHIKYALTREQPQAKMRDELAAANDLGVRFLIPQQGMRWHFR